MWTTRWRNNVEASTSCGFKRPRQEFLKSSPTPTSPTVMMYLDDHSVNQKIVPYDQAFSIKQILSNLHSQANNFTIQS
jgi:3-deoxy-D-manno-octulosonic-acid transferase